MVFKCLTRTESYVSLIMKPTATAFSGTHPADRILAVVEGLQDEIATLKQMLELSAEIRLTRERAELEAYLKGLRFNISPD